MIRGYFLKLRSLTSGDSLRAKLLRGGIGSLAVKAGNALLGFAVAVALARTLGPEGYGAYSFALAIIMLAAVPAQVGVPQLIVRETAKAQVTGNFGLMRGLWRWGNVAVLMFSAVALFVVGGIVGFTDFGGGARVATLTAGIALIPVIALAKVRGACLRGLRRVVLGQLPESIIRPALLLFLVTVWGSGFAGGPLSPQAAMGFYVAAAVLAFVVGAWCLQCSKPAELNERPAPEYEFSVWRKAVIPLAMITGLQLLNNYVDLIILGIYRSDSEVGVYRAVLQAGLLVVFGFHVLGKVLQPYFSAFYIQKDVEKLKKIYFSGQVLVVSFSLIVFLFFHYFGGVFLKFVFGDSFVVGWLALSIVAAGKIFHAFMGLSWDVLNMTGHEKTTFIVTLVSVLLNAFLSLLLIPEYGMNGAAFSTFASFLVIAVLARFYVQKYVFN